MDGAGTQTEHAAHGAHLAHEGRAPAGHDAHAGHGDHVALFRRRFWASLVLTIPVVLYSDM